MDIYPGQTSPSISLDLKGDPLYGMFRRTDTETLHLLPLDGGYEKKLTEDGKPLFVLTKRKPARDDVVVPFRNDVQHAERR